MSCSQRGPFRPDRPRFCPSGGRAPAAPPQQYVSPRPPALPPPALACHALLLVAGSRLPLGSRAGSGRECPPSSCARRRHVPGEQSGGRTSGRVGRARMRTGLAVGPPRAVRERPGPAVAARCPETGWGLALVPSPLFAASRVGGERLTGALRIPPRAPCREVRRQGWTVVGVTGTPGGI